MQIVREGLGPILMGMRASVGSDVMRLPIGGRAIGVVCLKRLIVIPRLVAEDTAEKLVVRAAGNEPFEIIMRDFMPEMPEQRTIWFTHLLANFRTQHVVGFSHVERDLAMIVTRQNLALTVLPRCRRQKVEGE